MSSPELSATRGRTLVRPGIAALAVAAAAAAGVRAGLHFEAILAVAFVGVLAAISVVDLEERRVPNVIVLPATAIALLAQGLLHSDRFLECLLAGFGAGLFFLLAALLWRNSVGMGDVKLVLLLGVVLGTDVVLALFVAGIAGAIAGLVLIATSGFSARKRTLPFAPMLALGGVAALLVGQPALYA